MPYESSLYCQCMRCQEKVVWRNWRPGASPRGGHVHPTFARGDVIPEIDANPVSFFGRRGSGSVMVWSFTHPHITLLYVKFKMTILEFAVLSISALQFKIPFC